MCRVFCSNIGLDCANNSSNGYARQLSPREALLSAEKCVTFIDTCVNFVPILGRHEPLQEAREKAGMVCISGYERYRPPRSGDLQSPTGNEEAASPPDKTKPAIANRRSL